MRINRTWLISENRTREDALVHILRWFQIGATRIIETGQYNIVSCDMSCPRNKTDGEKREEVVALS